MEISDDNLNMKHVKTIIHLDVDCFYAQVEMLTNPEHANKPLGVRQKNIVVTSNYIARQYGIRKCMNVDEAMALCPNLVLVCGENLTPYRRMSAKISQLLHQYTPMVERLGLDENFVDVTQLVDEYLTNLKDRENRYGEDPKGHIYGSKVLEECPCGCHERLCIGSRIAADIRNRIKSDLGLTCSAGIAHNKLLAKLAGGINKPDDQTLVYPCNATELVVSMGSVSKIPGIGHKTAELLSTNNIKTVNDVRKMSLEELQLKIGKDLARKMKDLSEGIDNCAVKPSGKPQSIGLEDGFRKVSLVHDVESRLGALLRRLSELAAEDGRIPIAMKLTVRKQVPNKANSGKRESRQCALPAHLLPSQKNSSYDHAKILSLAMKLFHRAVDVSKPFHLTLLGLAFTKFEEKSTGKSITSFLRKQVAVQSLLNISSEEGIPPDSNHGSPMSTNQDSNDSIESSFLNGSRNSMDVTNSPKSFVLGDQTDEDEFANEVEPSPKKTKLEVWLSGRKESPSNEMAGLRLSPSSPVSTTSRAESMVLKSLPLELQKEVPLTWATQSKPKSNNLLKYFIANK